MNSQYMRVEIFAFETCILKNFWEERIQKQTEERENETARKQRSALQRLRNEWAERLNKKMEVPKTQNNS
ncbi:protein FAM240B-like [Xenopus laevis]|uniref:Protein FAM240B-like n=1 Tax=Xenopus laevis TaxID=8355 RepID=A0A8J1LVS2_XENLA|nr:protein FAM240B-like [Xenopus laevis]